MDLNRVVTFIRVVEAGSFTAAAKLLHLPTSSVSRSVAKLERELGIVLFERTTRRISLTDAGRAYYGRASEAVAGLNEATLLANEAAREPSGLVRVASPPEMSGGLTMVLADFVRQHPKIHVDVVMTGRGAELVGAEVDVALVVGRLDDSDLLVRKLGPVVHRLYAAASYIERRGIPPTVADLSRHDAVLYRGTRGRGAWELVGPHGPEHVKVKGPLSGDNFQFVLDAVSSGNGIGLLPEHYLTRGYSSALSLVPILPEFVSMGAVQSLVSPSRHLPRRVTVLRDFLSAHLFGQCGSDASGGSRAADPVISPSATEPPAVRGDLPAPTATAARPHGT